MTFTYPAVFTPHKDGKGYHAVFPDLECCEADGPDLEDAIEDARDAAYNLASGRAGGRRRFSRPDSCGGYGSAGRCGSEKYYGSDQAAAGQ